MFRGRARHLSVTLAKYRILTSGQERNILFVYNMNYLKHKLCVTGTRRNHHSRSQLWALWGSWCSGYRCLLGKSEIAGSDPALAFTFQRNKLFLPRSHKGGLKPLTFHFPALRLLIIVVNTVQ